MALTAKKVYAILKRQISDMEAKLNSPVRYRGTVATADLLPLNPDIGDMYNIESKSVYGEAGMNVAWNGVVWDTMGAPIDMSLYLTKEEAETVIQRLVTEYFEKNPVKPGATTEQAQQIEQNKTDIASLKTETGSLKEDFASKVVYPVEMETLKENCFSLSCNEKIVTLVDNSEMIGKRLKVCGENLFNVDDFRILNKFVNSGEDNSYACLPIYVNPNTAYSINISIKDEAKFNEFKALSGQITIGCRKGYPNDWEATMFTNLTESASFEVVSDEYGMLYVSCQYIEQSTLDKLWESVDVMISEEKKDYVPYIGYDKSFITEERITFNDSYKNAFIHKEVKEASDWIVALPNPVNTWTSFKPNIDDLGIVSFKREQYLTNKQKKQARENIGIESSSTNKGIKPLFLELSADYNWVSNNEIPIFSASNERFADGTTDGNNAYFKINGNKGDNFVTVIEGGNALISDVTITGWWGAIISNDGVHYYPCNARYKDGNTIEIYPPLSENITDGELGNIKTGIHLSKRGYLGYAQKAFSLNPKWCEKGKPIAKFRVGDTDKFIKFGGLASLSFNGLENMANEFLCRYAITFSSLDFYNGWAGHETPTGIEWETELGGKSGYLELFVGGRNASYIEYPDGYEIHIEVYINGVKSYEKIKKNQIVERICIDFKKADIGKIRIYSNKWSAINSDVYGFSFGPVTWWENEKTYKRTDCIFEKYATVAQMFDSWGVFHNSAVAKELSRLQKKDCAVYVPWENHSKGSQTSAWGKGWFYENVLKYHPQYMIIDFLINDGNSTVTSGFPATVEGSDGTVYNNLISKDEYITNMIDLCKMAIANGIQPIVFGCCLHDGIDWYHALVDAQENVTY